MKAMVLAAGEGSRLRPRTNEKPKPMLEIAGMPILEHNVRLLAKHGVDEIVVNVHYRPEVITEYFGDGTRFGVSITYSHEPILLGTAGGLKRVAGLFQEEDFFLIYGDNIADLDLESLFNHHKLKRSLVTMALFEREDPRSSGIVGMDEDDRVVRFLEKPRASQVFSHWVNAGFLVLNPGVLEMIPESQTCDFGRDVFEQLIRSGEPVYGYRMSGPLWWIDSIEDYERTRQGLCATTPLEPSA